MWSYDPKLDADVQDLNDIPYIVKSWLRCEHFIWDGTSQVPNFKDDIIKYWRACLKLARSLVKVFALCQGLPETYFDELTTYPGADGVLNYYPGLTADEASKPVTDEVGIGSHTDLQCFTLLWQDDIGGLQVLNNEDQWIKAKPIPGTLVVNIGDFLMRMSNDKFKSTVHRVFNRTTLDRYSMPFFFGFNFNEICSVLPTCIDEKHPAKYEPISCGEVSQNPSHSTVSWFSSNFCSGVVFASKRCNWPTKHRQPQRETRGYISRLEAKEGYWDIKRYP